MWEYEAISIDYDGQKLSEGLKGHPTIAAVLSSYATRNWEVVTMMMLEGSSGPMFILRRPVDEDTSSRDRGRAGSR